MKGRGALSDSPFNLKEGRVILRPFTKRELLSDEYLRWMNNPNVTSTIGRFDYLFPVTRAKLVEYFKSINPDETAFLAIYWFGRFCGTVKIYDLEPLSRRASIGIMVCPERWGRGIATTTIRCVCRYVFDVLGYSKVTAGYVRSNIAMHKAFEKNGFKVEGVLRKHLFISGELDDHVFVAKFR